MTHSDTIPILQTARYHLKMLLSALDQLEGVLGSGRPVETPGAGKKPRRKLSAAGRKRIAEATRKRWALKRAAQDAARKTPLKSKKASS
jgi:hypothetical protein